MGHPGEGWGTEIPILGIVAVVWRGGTGGLRPTLRKGAKDGAPGGLGVGLGRYFVCSSSTWIE